ncbi:MerC domain-containing protein [Sphingomonas sp. CFBP 8764]|nr:MerC domain-containing protein [Sphingomonas sp. CFBP 8764]
MDYLLGTMSTTAHHHTHAHPSWIAGLDRYAIGLSGLCMVHCLATSVLVALMSTAGGVLLDPIFHEVGLTIAILFGAVALGRGILHHGYAMPAAMGAFGLGIMAGAMTLPHDSGSGETLWTIIGVALLAFGHDLNRRADS